MLAAPQGSQGKPPASHLTAGLVVLPEHGHALSLGCDSELHHSPRYAQTAEPAAQPPMESGHVDWGSPYSPQLHYQVKGCMQLS